MSFPYIIWTLRRTGGTTLTALVNGLSEHPTVQHEPLNEERVFGHISKSWRLDQDQNQLTQQLQEALAKRPLIKHCFELVAPEVNQTLADVATELGYRHVYLDRRDEVGRILSLELAKLTGVWGKEGSFKIYNEMEAGKLTLDPFDTASAVVHLRYCHQRRAEVQARLQETADTYHEVYFEDVYTDFDQGRETVGQLLDFLGIDVSTVPDYTAQLTNALKRRGQNSARVMDLVPNIDETRAALQSNLSALQPDAAQTS